MEPKQNNFGTDLIVAIQNSKKFRETLFNISKFLFDNLNIESIMQEYYNKKDRIVASKYFPQNKSLNIGNGLNGKLVIFSPTWETFSINDKGPIHEIIFNIESNSDFESSLSDYIGKEQSEKIYFKNVNFVFNFIISPFQKALFVYNNEKNLFYSYDSKCFFDFQLSPITENGSTKQEITKIQSVYFVQENGMVASQSTENNENFSKFLGLIVAYINSRFSFFFNNIVNKFIEEREKDENNFILVDRVYYETIKHLYYLSSPSMKNILQNENSYVPFLVEPRNKGWFSFSIRFVKTEIDTQDVSANLIVKVSFANDPNVDKMANIDDMMAKDIPGLLEITIPLTVQFTKAIQKNVFYLKTKTAQRKGAPKIKKKGTYNQIIMPVKNLGNWVEGIKEPAKNKEVYNAFLPKCERIVEEIKGKIFLKTVKIFGGLGVSLTLFINPEDGIIIEILAQSIIEGLWESLGV